MYIILKEIVKLAHYNYFNLNIRLLQNKEKFHCFYNLKKLYLIINKIE